MVPMKKRTAVAVTLGVWIAALGSAAALTYDLNSTPHFASVTAQPTTPSTAAPAAVARPAPETQPVLVVPTVTIVGVMHHSMANAPKPQRPVDINQMRCADWRELNIGSGHVQMCE
jgi:hypothetical protein